MISRRIPPRAPAHVRPDAAPGSPARGPAVISASRRTDIPALYSEWLCRRLDAGWCDVRHPFTGRLRRVSLAPEDVLGWVFWSRHYAPFLEVLARLHARRDRFLCHLTVTGLPRQFEPRVPAREAALAGGLAVAERFGPDVLQWRYDPVLLSDATPPEWHLENFARLAARLTGATRRCIFSFPTMYARTRHNLAGLSIWRLNSEGTAADCGAGVSPAIGGTCGAGVSPAVGGVRGVGRTFTREDLGRLAAGLAALARERGIALEVCCGEEWASEQAGIGRARCVDWSLLKSLGAGRATGMGGAGRLAEMGIANALAESDGRTFVVPPSAGNRPHSDFKSGSVPFPAEAGTTNVTASEARKAGTMNVRPSEPKLPARPMRPGCGCYPSVDIGRYETCSHGCAYCYAVQTPARALANRAAHDPEAPSL